MTDQPQSLSNTKTIWERLRRQLQQWLGFVYGSVIVGILVNLVSNLLSFSSIYNWVAQHLLISGLIGGGILLLTALAFLGGRSSVSTATMTASSGLDQENRAKTLKRIRKIWIEGMLDKSLDRAARIDLNLEEQPEALENPWQFQVQELGPEFSPLPIGTSILEIYDEADGELLILGEPGGGKTTLLLELTRGLLERAERDEELRIPIVFHVASWARKHQPLDQWLAEELQTKYKVPRKVSERWIVADQILPLIDGLDEVAKDARSAFVEQINEYQSRLDHGSSPLVVSCRSEEYAALSTHIKLQRAVRILPLTSAQIEAYLEQAGKQVAGLKQALEEDSELYSLARQPLMLNIFCLAYQGATVSEAPAGKTREEMQRIIFTRYVERMLKRRGQPEDWNLEQAPRWLAFLASRMQRHDQASFSLDDLQPTWLSGKKWRTFYRCCAGLLIGLIYGAPIGLLAVPLMGLFWGTIIGLCTGLFACILMGLLAEGIILLTSGKDEVRSELSCWLAEMISWLIAGLFFGLCTGLIAGLLAWLLGGLIGGLLTGLLAGLFMGLITWMFSWLENTSSGWRAGLLTALIAIPFHWLPIWLFAEILGGPLGGLLGGTLGGLSIRLFTGVQSLVKRFILRCLLSWQDGLPWKLSPFLDEAAERLLLRKVGGSYIFIHRLLLEYFASLDESHD
jgi:NACHT domain